MSVLSVHAAAVKGVSRKFRVSLPALPGHGPSSSPPTSSSSAEGNAAASSHVSTELPCSTSQDGCPGSIAMLSTAPATSRGSNYIHQNIDIAAGSTTVGSEILRRAESFRDNVTSAGIDTPKLHTAVSPETSHRWLDSTLSAVLDVGFSASSSVDVVSSQTYLNDDHAQSLSEMASLTPSGRKIPQPERPECNAHNSPMSGQERTARAHTGLVRAAEADRTPTGLHKLSVKNAHDSTSALDMLQAQSNVPGITQSSSEERTITARAQFMCRSVEGEQEVNNVLSSHDLTSNQDRCNAAIRNHAVVELLETERSYLEDMRHIVQVFIEPVRKLPFLTNAQKEVLVRSTYELLRFHEEFGAALRAAGNNSDEIILFEIARCFISSEQSFGLYVDHCARYDETLQLLRNLQGKPEWESFINGVSKARHDSKSHGRLRLTDYLIAPVQRICRYPLLIKKILRYTAPELEPETCSALESALEVAKRTAAAVDTQRQRLEIAARTERFLSRLEEEPRLPRSFARSLGDVLLAGPLDVVLLNHDPTVSIPVRPKYLGCFVFGHWMIIVRVRRGSLTYEPKYWFPLVRWDIIGNLADENATVKNAFRLIHLHQRYEIEFGAPSPQEQAIWVDVLRRVLAVSRLESPVSPAVEAKHSSLPCSPLPCEVAVFTGGTSSCTTTSTTSSDPPDEASGCETTSRGASGWDSRRLGGPFAGIATSRSAANLAALASGGGSGCVRPAALRRSASYDVKALLRRSSSSARRRASIEEKLADVCTFNIQTTRAKNRLAAQVATASVSGPLPNPWENGDSRGGSRESLFSGAMSGLRRSLSNLHEKGSGG